MKFKVCPFCGRAHLYDRSYLNIRCACGAKYYFHLNEWLDQTGHDHRKSISLPELVSDILGKEGNK